MSREANNNVHITSFDVVEHSTAASLSPMSKIWILLTPKVLKVIIVVLTLAVVIGVTIIIIIIVTNVNAFGKPLLISTTLSPSTATLTSPTLTTPAEVSTSTISPISSSAISSQAVNTTASVTSTVTTATTSTTITTASTLTTIASSSTSTTTVSSSSSSSSSLSTPAGCIGKDEFLCGSGECISWDRLCDGLPHCKDGSDEGVDCVCAADQWQCTSGQCIPLSAHCNQAYDCHDSSDEKLCPDCSGFQCDTGLCLWDGHQRRCNGVFDCTDLSDEMGCAPRAGTVECKNSVLVRQSQWCDGLDHCGDNSDEIDCAAMCSGMRVACPDGQCIQRTWLCDGYEDCLNGTDEKSCGTCLPSQIICDDYRCVPETSVCDGLMDCRRGADELHCLSAQDGTSGILWARYQGKDFAVCADTWSTDFAIQICTDIDQLQLIDWQEVKPPATVTQFVAFNNTTSGARTTNLIMKSHCSSGRIVSITCSQLDCGERKVAFLQSFVAGGQIASAGKWPWMVSLLHLGRPICGGTLVNNSWVVTAAHCILDAAKEKYDLTSTPYYFDVMLGSTHRLGQSRIDTPYRIRADRIILYPNLTQSANGGVDWDIALIKLSVPVDFTDYIQPICLPHQGQTVPLTSLCYVAGWGLMNYQEVLSPDQLRDARMQLWSDTRCARNIIPGESIVNTNSTVCAGFPFGQPSTCQGDSGGPLLCLSPSGRWMLAGVLSQGSTPCGFYQPGLRANRFVKVANTVQWIRHEMSLT